MLQIAVLANHLNGIVGTLIHCWQESRVHIELDIYKEMTDNISAYDPNWIHELCESSKYSTGTV